MKTFSVKNNDLETADRFVPKYFQTLISSEEADLANASVRLGDVAKISDGEHSAIPRKLKGDVRYLYGRNIKESVINFDYISDMPYISKIDFDSHLRCHIEEDDVLIAIYGTVGKSAVYKSQYIGEAGIPRHVANITLSKKAPFTPEYLTVFFRSKFGKEIINANTTGNIQKLLSLKSLREIEIPLLSPTVIKLITDIEQKALTKEIAGLHLIKQAQEALYGALGNDIRLIVGNNCYSVDIKDMINKGSFSPKLFDTAYKSVCERLSQKVKCVKLGEIVTVDKGIEVGSANYNSYETRKKYFRPFIRTSDVVNYELDLYPDYYVDSNIKLRNYQCSPGDVLFSKDGKIGAVALYTSEDNAIVSSGFAILRLNDYGRQLGLTQEYIFTVLSLPELGKCGADAGAVVASTIPHLRPERLNDLCIPVIERKIIKQISSLVKEAFQLKADRKKLLGKYESYFDEQINSPN